MAQIISKIKESSIINDYINSNLTEKEIGKKHDVSSASVRNIWKRNGLQKRPRVRHQSLIDRLVNTCDDNYFETIETIEKAWLLGFICGDATVQKKQMCIELSIKDIGLLEKIKKMLKADIKIATRSRIHPVTKNVFTNCYLVIHRKKMCEDLTRLGISSNKSNVLHMPPIKKEFIPHFLRGMVCSDGNFTISDDNGINFTFACPVYDFIKEFQDILIRELNFEKTDIPFKRGCYKLRYNGNYQVRKLFEYLYPDDMGDAYLERKYNYCKQHFYNLDNNIPSRIKGDSALEQTSFVTDLRDLPILKTSDMTHRCHVSRELKSSNANLEPEVPDQPKPQSIKEFLKQKAELKKLQNDSPTN